MTVVFSSSISNSDEYVEARIAHSLNWFTGGTASATSTDTNYFLDAPDNSLTYEKWKPNSMPGTWTLTLSGSDTANYCCIAAHNLGTTGCTVAIQYDAGGGTWTDLVTAFAPSDDSPIMAIFPDTSAAAWRVTVSAGSAPVIGVIRFGEALVMPRPLYGGHAPLDLARSTQLRANYSETGEFLGRAKQRSILSTSYEWKHLTAAWMRTNWPTLQSAIESEPFFLAWRPGSFGEVGYCQVDKLPIPTNMGIRDLMQVNMSVRALAWQS